MKNYKLKVVIDTNVFVTALRSRRGASFKLLFEINPEKFIQNISTSLIFEYESAAKRETKLPKKQIDAILDTICQISRKSKIFFLWRPFLRDPKNDFILELAIESESEYIITYNKKHFKNIEKFDIKLLDPKEFLEK